jgi:dihydroorotate dehydrogenase
MAHQIALRAMASSLRSFLPRPPETGLSRDLSTQLPGIGELRHPVGLAAGYDKDATAIQGWGRMGFSFGEVGTVTPRPQPGNDRPRLWRQKDQMALVNRMGFNGQGVERVAARLSAAAWDHDALPLGVNAGKNKLTPQEDAYRDYVEVIHRCQNLARFFVVNVSSPNTPGLRGLATPEFLGELAQELGPKILPRVWVKYDPDMNKASFQALVEATEKWGFQGLVLTNTHRVEWPWQGGQSGHSLATPAAQRLDWAYEVHQGRLPMIASGGILSGGDVFQRLIRGASAVEIFTALVYRGPWAVALILGELEAELHLCQAKSVTEVIGSQSFSAR